MSDVKIAVNEVKVVVNRTFSGFLSSLKQEILNGYASCAKSEIRNGFFSAQLVKATDSGYVSAVSKMKEDECNAFKITFFVEGLSTGIYVEENPKVEDIVVVESEKDVEVLIEKKPVQKRQRKGKQQ